MNWESFTKSLETTGGKVAMLAILLIWLGTIAFVMHETGHDPASTGVALLSNAFTSLFTALMVHLSHGGAK